MVFVVTGSASASKGFKAMNVRRRCVQTTAMDTDTVEAGYVNVKLRIKGRRVILYLVKGAVLETECAM